MEHATMYSKKLNVTEVAEEAENPHVHLGPSKTRVHKSVSSATDMVVGIFTCDAQWS